MTSEHHAHQGPGFATPADAMQAPREQVVYVAAMHTGTGVEEPDFLATVDVDPDSPTYSSIIARTPMPNLGDDTNSLYSSWDNQFYGPDMGSWLLRLRAGDEGLAVDPDFFVDFAPARAHEVHLPGGDPTTEIFS